MNHFRPLGHLDTFPVLASLGARLALFDQVTVRQTYPGSAHGDTRSIFLRGPEWDAETPLIAWLEDRPHVHYPSLEDWPELSLLLANVLVSVDPTCARALGKVMIAELAPGGAIGWHVDEGDYAEAHERFHVPLTTNPGCVMYSGGESIHLPVGMLTAFDNHALHSAINAGLTPRMHLIVDVRRA